MVHCAGWRCPASGEPRLSCQYGYCVASLTPRPARAWLIAVRCGATRFGAALLGEKPEQDGVKAFRRLQVDQVTHVLERFHARIPHPGRQFPRPLGHLAHAVPVLGFGVGAPRSGAVARATMNRTDLSTNGSSC